LRGAAIEETVRLGDDRCLIRKWARLGLFTVVGKTWCHSVWTTESFHYVSLIRKVGVESLVGKEEGRTFRPFRHTQVLSREQGRRRFSVEVEVRLWTKTHAERYNETALYVTCFCSGARPSHQYFLISRNTHNAWSIIAGPESDSSIARFNAARVLRFLSIELYAQQLWSDSNRLPQPYEGTMVVHDQAACLIWSKEAVGRGLLFEDSTNDRYRACRW